LQEYEMHIENEQAPATLQDVTVRLHPEDDVAIAKTELQPGTRLTSTAGETALPEITVQQLIPSGHKIALREIVAGEAVRRYGQVIGFAKVAVRPGEHVHKHNLGMGDLALDYAFGADAEPVDLVPESERRTFLGYKRPNGQVGTRNCMAVISTVSCSAHVTRAIARHFTPERLAAYPNVDGVMAVTHLSGCSFVSGGPVYTSLQRTLAGVACHPNVAASIIVGLGCEVNQIDELVGNYGLAGEGAHALRSLVIQDMGGSRKTVQAGIAAIEELLAVANAVERTPQPISELMLALQCGGSDGWSGVSANPLVGMVSDEVVQQGGTVVLAETPEIYGAEHLLTRRAISSEVGQKLVDKVRWWEKHTQKHGAEIDNNPTPGNITGGLTTIYEKSLGAVTKGGRTPLMGVYDYAERVTARGFTFMDSPGNDPVSVTGQMAGGCNLVLFTTGRGSVVGFQPAPSIKIASNSTLYQRMKDDMDFNAGRMLEGEDINGLAAELLDLVINVASGQPSKSEELGSGEEVFSPWLLGELV
jgi:altronate hydrolase